MKRHDHLDRESCLGSHRLTCYDAGQILWGCRKNTNRDPGSGGGTVVQYGFGCD